MQPGKNITKGPGKTAVITEQLMPKHNEKTTADALRRQHRRLRYDDGTEGHQTLSSVFFNRYMNDDTQNWRAKLSAQLRTKNPRIVLQGRDENKGSLRPSEKTILLGTQEEVLIHEA